MYTLQVYGLQDREILEMVSNYVFDTVEEALKIKEVVERYCKCQVSVYLKGG